MGSHRKMDYWAVTEPEEAAALLDGMQAPWWIAGGHAIDLFVGRRLRNHEDLDVGVPRRDQLAVREHLHDWDLRSFRYYSDPSDLTPWKHGEWVNSRDRSVWCRPAANSPWTLEIMLLDMLEDEWIFRHAPAVTLPLARMERRTSSGIPYLAPELALLFKAGVMRPKDEEDFRVALPLMDADARRWLANAILAVNPRHLWLNYL